MTDGSGMVPGGKSAFARARERLKARERQQGTSARPARHEQTPQDSVIMGYLCAQTGAPFTVVFGRDNADEKYRVINILTGQSSRHGLAPSDTKDMPANIFRWGGIQCPHCEAAGGGVHCSVCGHDVCAGTKRHMPDGSRRFRCQPACGNENGIETATRVQARLPGEPGGPDISTAGPLDFSRVRAGVLRLPPPKR